MIKISKNTCNYIYFREKENINDHCIQTYYNYGTNMKETLDNMDEMGFHFLAATVRADKFIAKLNKQVEEAGRIAAKQRKIQQAGLLFGIIITCGLLILSLILSFL